MKGEAISGSFQSLLCLIDLYEILTACGFILTGGFYLACQGGVSGTECSVLLNIMDDLIYIGVLMAFFAASAAYVRVCKKL